MSLVKTPPRVSIPRDRGVTSSNSTSVTSPASTPPCKATGQHTVQQLIIWRTTPNTVETQLHPPMGMPKWGLNLERFSCTSKHHLKPTLSWSQGKVPLYIHLAEVYNSLGNTDSGWGVYHEGGLSKWRLLHFYSTLPIAVNWGMITFWKMYCSGTGDPSRITVDCTN